MADRTDKRTDFLWIVQMIMWKHADAIQGWSGIAGDAVAASHRLPANLTARDAAVEFCAFFVDGFGGAERPECPHWIAGLPDPTYTG